MNFADYAILFLYWILLLFLTWKYRKTSDESAHFFLAGRSLGALSVGLSIMVTSFSAVNYLALPGEVFVFGLYVSASLPAFFIAAIPITKYWIPFFHKIQAVSVYAFLENRYDLKVRILCSALFLLWRLFWMAAALYASCRIMSILTGMNFLLILLICGLGAAVYCTFGGMRAVIQTDVLQFFVLFGSILFGVITAFHGSDSVSVLLESGKLQPFYPADMKWFSLDPTERITVWSALIGSITVFMTRFGGDQMVMQRYLSAKSTNAAKRGLWINAAVSVVSLSLLMLFGLALVIYAREHDFPAASNPIQILASMLKSFPPGSAGIIAAGLFAATMSSIDSGLNSCSAALVTDFRERFHLPEISPKTMTALLAVPVISAAGFLLPALNRTQTLFTILNKIVNTIGTPLLAVMICAIFCKKTHAAAVFAGTLAGTVITVFISCFIENLALHYYAVQSLFCTLLMIYFAEGILWLRHRFSVSMSK